MPDKRNLPHRTISFGVVMRRVGGVLLVVLLLQVVRAHLIFKDYFADINYTVWSNSTTGTRTAEDVKCPPGRTSTCVHFGVTYCNSAPPCYRSELSGGTPNFDIGGEYWFGFSLYLPPTYTQDTMAPDDIHFQIHGTPRMGWNTSLSPVFAISVSTMQWRVETRGDPRWNLTVNDPKWYHTALVGAAEPGKWVDFVVHSLYRFNDTGFAYVWMNGHLVFGVNNTGTCYNDAIGPYMKIGIYKWEWEKFAKYTTTEIETYYAAVQVGDHTSSYNEVYTGNIHIPSVSSHIKSEGDTGDNVI